MILSHRGKSLCSSSLLLMSLFPSSSSSLNPYNKMLIFLAERAEVQIQVCFQEDNLTWFRFTVWVEDTTFLCGSASILTWTSALQTMDNKLPKRFLHQLLLNSVRVELWTNLNNCFFLHPSVKRSVSHFPFSLCPHLLCACVFAGLPLLRTSFRLGSAGYSVRPAQLPDVQHPVWTVSSFVEFLCVFLCIIFFNLKCQSLKIMFCLIWLEYLSFIVQCDVQNLTLAACFNLL